MTSLLNVHDFRKGHRDIFIDTEFLQIPGEKTQLISVAMVEEYSPGVMNYTYLVSNEFDLEAAKKHHFVGPNVIPHIGVEQEFWASEEQIRNQLRLWVGDPTHVDPLHNGFYPRFWAWFSGLDFAVIHDLYGGIDGWPPEWPMTIMDLAQLKFQIAPRMRLRKIYAVDYDGVPHNALYDAFQLQQKFKHFCELLEPAVQTPEAEVQ